MPESLVATPHPREEAPSPTRSAAAPEVAAPEAATEVAAQALVRALHPGAGGGAAGAPTPPPPSTWAARRSAGPRDFVALQRMAGNRAVAGLVARPTVQRDGPGKGTPPPGAGTQGDKEPPQVGEALEIPAQGLHEAATRLADGVSRLNGPAIIIGLQPTFVIIYDKQGKPISDKIKIDLKKGMHFDQGVFVIAPEGGQTRRLRHDPNTGKVDVAEVAGILVEKPAGDPAAAQVPGKAKSPTALMSAGGAGDPANSATPSGFDLRAFIKDQAPLDAALKGIPANAWEFFLVPTIVSGTGGRGGGARTSGFAGEVEGQGTPANRPPWPVTMDGPKMLPIGGKGTYLANINWQAQGGGVSGAALAQMGNDIHYRWELFDITELANREKEKQAARAKQAKEQILITMAKGLMPDVEPPKGPTSVASGGTGGKGAAGDAAAARIPKPATLEDDATLAEDIKEKTGRKAGSGTAVESDRNDEFNREFGKLWGDTKRTWAAVGQSKADTFTERRSDDVANLTSVGLLPISTLVTVLGASLRWGSDAFAGERQQMDVPIKSAGTYLVRVITTPRVQTDREGNEIIRPSSVASQTVEVVEMERMVREGLDEPGAREAEAAKALRTAMDAQKEGKGSQKDVDALKSKLENVHLDVAGDPRHLLQARIADKQKELTAVKEKWEKFGIKGPIIEVEDQIDVLKKRLELYNKQEARRTEDAGNETRLRLPAERINATLISEVTGQSYPLVLSLGPMAAPAGKHKWKVLDATSKKAEGFEGDTFDTASAAIESALTKFGGDAQYGRGIIGVRLPPFITNQMEKGARTDYRIPSQPIGWAVARGRIDDLVMTLVALGLIVASAGTAAAIIGGAVAVAKLINRLYQGTLEMDVETISDFLAVFGAAGAIAQSGAKAAQVATGIRVKRLGDVFVMLPESAELEAKFAQATAAFARAGDIARKVEWANEALGYAGLVFGNATFLIGMADISIAEADGKMTHAEARRARATAIGGAIQNNGLFLAGNRMKAREAKKAADKAAAARAASTTGSGGTTSESTTTAPKEAVTTGEPVVPKETTAPKESTAPKEPVAPQEPATGGKRAHDDAPTKGGEPKKGGSTEPVEPIVIDAPGSTREPVAGEPKAAAGPAEPAAPKPAGEAPAPGSAKARAAAKKVLEGVVTSTEPHVGVEDAIKQANGWKEALKTAVGKLKGPDRAAAEKALVEVRQKIVDDTWAAVQKAAPRTEGGGGKFDNLRIENAGTTAFGSDVDATIRPLKGTEAEGTGARMAEQIKLAGEAAQAMSEALRARLGGGETDIVIDTNIYSFIGEGRIKVEGKAQAQQQQVDIVVGLAEQMRGQNEAQFKGFQERLIARLGDPRVAAEARSLLAKAKDFHDARIKELGAAMKRATDNPSNKTDAARKRAAREELLQQKKNDLAALSAQVPPNIEKITEKQAEINWFAPDAYATPSAFKQAVAHGQRLKGTGRMGSEMSGPEVATKLREAAGRLPADDPHAGRLKADAQLVEDQQRLLDSTLREQKALEAEAPMNAERVDDLGRRADRVREAIASRAERMLISEIMGETAPTGPGDKPSPERLSQSAAASGANVGMMHDHVRHAGDIDGKVKAAAKYAARIAMAELLSGLRPAGDAIAQLLGEFVKSRWGIADEIGPEILRDMFLEYAKKTNRSKEIVYGEKGPVGVTDDCKQAFVHDVMTWANATNEGIQAAAIGSKAFDSPVSPAPAPGGTQTPTGGTQAPTGGARPSPVTGGKPGNADTAASIPSQDRPTIPVPAPLSDNGPATVRDGGGGAAAKPKAPAERAPTEPGSKLEEIPGGIKIETDQSSVTVKAKDSPNALVRIEPVQNTLRLTDIYRREMPPGTGVILLAEALKAVQAVRGNEILVHNIRNPETLESHKAGQEAALSKLGKTVARALESIGLTAGKARWEFVDEKLCIVVDIE